MKEKVELIHIGICSFLYSCNILLNFKAQYLELQSEAHTIITIYQVRLHGQVYHSVTFGKISGVEENFWM